MVALSSSDVRFVFLMSAFSTSDVCCVFFPSSPDVRFLFSCSSYSSDVRFFLFWCSLYILLIIVSSSSDVFSFFFWRSLHLLLMFVPSFYFLFVFFWYLFLLLRMFPNFPFFAVTDGFRWLILILWLSIGYYSDSITGVVCIGSIWCTIQHSSDISVRIWSTVFMIIKLNFINLLPLYQ
jgi:hypothetical protein